MQRGGTSAAERVARQRIERTERLVHEHDARLGGERACDADALPLAARELRGHSGRRTAAASSTSVEQLGDARGDPLGGPSPAAAA